MSQAAPDLPRTLLAGSDEPPASDCAATPAREHRRAVAAALAALLPPDCVLSRDEELRPYECDALSVFRQQPMLVVLPRTEEQVRAVMRECRRLGVP
ncbi:MAG: FAD-binding oxidoreductase, partial [Steroidobacteraceae bacterium]